MAERTLGTTHDAFGPGGCVQPDGPGGCVQPDPEPCACGEGCGCGFPEHVITAAEALRENLESAKESNSYLHAWYAQMARWNIETLIDFVLGEKAEEEEERENFTLTVDDALTRSDIARAIGLAESLEHPLPGVELSNGARAVASEIGVLLHAALARSEPANEPG